MDSVNCVHLQFWGLRRISSWNWQKSAEGIDTGAYEGKSKVKIGKKDFDVWELLIFNFVYGEEGFGRGI